MVKIKSKNTQSQAKADNIISNGVAETEGSVDTIESSAEIGGYQGPEPTRYGDWEKQGRCIDF